MEIYIYYICIVLLMFIPSLQELKVACVELSILSLQQTFSEVGWTDSEQLAQSHLVSFHGFSKS